MAHHLLKETGVDIYQYPETFREAQADQQITIGDLHGNAMKLLFILVKEGVASGLTASNYDKLVEIYKKNVLELTKEDIDEFNDILGRMQFNKTQLRLIGDELGDRGSNDYFTLKIIEKLAAQEVPFEITISNHSIEFLEAHEQHHETESHYHAPMLRDGLANSLENLNILLEKGIIDGEEINNIAQYAYKPNLKVLSYSLNQANGDHPELTIYSHAAIGLANVQQLAALFHVSYVDVTPQALARTIDAINQTFQLEYVQTNRVRQLCPEHKMIEGYEGNQGLHSPDLSDAPLVFLMWNRNYRQIDRPFNNDRYSLVYVHGHDDADPLANEKYVHNLDDENNKLGKNLYSNRGTYAVLMTDKAAPAPILDDEGMAARAAIFHQAAPPTRALPPFLSAGGIGGLKKKLKATKQQLSDPAPDDSTDKTP